MAQAASISTRFLSYKKASSITTSTEPANAMLSSSLASSMTAASAVFVFMRQLQFTMPLLLVISVTYAPSVVGSRPGHTSLHLDPEAHVRMDPSQSVTMLGRHSFNVTVGQEHVDNWIVLFCVDWLEHCQGLWHDYRRMATQWEHALAPNASSWRATAVRFAEVDCAADKPLCNENHVEGYPSVVHFKNGKFAKAWEVSRDADSLSADISKWIGKELSPKLMREEPSKNQGELSGGRLSSIVVHHIRELFKLLSWKDPATAAIGYFVIAIFVAVFAWTVGTGLELDCQATFASVTEGVKKPWGASFLPELKQFAAPRSIVRTTMEL